MILLPDSQLKGNRSLVVDGERIRPGQCLVSDAVIPIDYVV